MDEWFEVQARVEELHGQGLIYMPFSAIAFGGDDRNLWAFGALQISEETGIRVLHIEPAGVDRESQVERLFMDADLELLRQGIDAAEGRGAVIPWREIVAEADRRQGLYWRLERQGQGWLRAEASWFLDS